MSRCRELIRTPSAITLQQPEVAIPLSTAPDPCVDRYRRLHAAQQAILGERSLDAMLERIVTSACAVLEVRFACLAVLAPDDSLEHVVHHHAADDDGGAEDAETAWPTDLRTGAQVARSLRARFGTSTSATRSVDVLVAGERYGQLHVADPVDGRLADSRELIEAMAHSIGSSLEHAQLVDRARRSTEWLHASGEIARALLADAEVDMFGEIVARAVAAADGDYAQLVIPTTSGDLTLIATAGLGADELRGAIYPADTSDLGRAIVNAKTMRMPDVNDFLSPAFDNRHGYTAFMIAPLIDAQGTRGSIMITRVAGRPAFSEYELDLFATYAAQVALAMQFADARADTARLQVLETRHETARELHDIVMQRLFATGVGMQTLVGQLGDTASSEQLGRYVRELDDTIEEIRARVFGLRGDAQSPAPVLTRFPRIALDAAATARDAGASAVRSVVRRGRRRSDWRDGTGQQHA